jgi:hypothetical protein
MNSFSLHEYGFVLRLLKLGKNLHTECVFPHFFFTRSTNVQIRSIEHFENPVMVECHRYLIQLPFW